MNPAPERILVIPLRYIGDSILTIPLLRNLRRNFPVAWIDVLASPTAAPLLETCPYINRVLIEPKGTQARLNLLRQGYYHAAFILRKSVTMALLCRLASIKQVVGYDKQRFPFGYQRWGWFLHRAARYPGLKTETPQAVSHLGLLEAFGLPENGQGLDDAALELWNTSADRARVDVLLVENNVDTQRPLAVLHAASASHGKEIAMAKFGASVRHLHESGYQILTTGTAADRPLYDTLQNDTGVPLVNLAGDTSLRETVELYRRIQILLTVDSSPIHMGAAAGVPRIVGVFGPTNEKQWGPHNPAVDFRPVFMDLPCRPCYAKVCSHNNCRTQLTDTQIAEAVHAAAKQPS